jgi:hypothetical protein
MAAGDLIVGPNYPQYEYNGLLMGSGTDFIVEKVTGLLDTPKIRSTDEERQDAWGDFPGQQDYKARHIGFDLKIRADTQQIMEQYIDRIPQVFIARQVPLQFIYQRPFGVKRFLWAKYEDMNFDSSYDVAHNLWAGSVMLKCDDPRKYALAEVIDPAVIAAGQTQAQINVTNNGSINGFPVLEIIGPCTNPRVQNQQYSNKKLQVNVTVAAGQTLMIDTKSMTVALNGVDYTDYLSNDSQWWFLIPAINQLTYSRDDSGAQSTCNVHHRDTWI